MASYISDGGVKRLQLDDGDTIPVVAPISLEGGNLVKLPDEQIAELGNITFPTEYPIPTAQVTDLKTVAVSNFPSGFSISNFPSGFSVSNLPATFPLSAPQEALLTTIRDWTQILSRGSGAADANTLRVAIASPGSPSVTRSSVLASVSATVLVTASSSRQSLKIVNDSPGVLLIGFGATNPTEADFSIRLFSRDFFDFQGVDARVQMRGIWIGTATGAARITEVV